MSSFVSRPGQSLFKGTLVRKLFECDGFLTLEFSENQDHWHWTLFHHHEFTLEKIPTAIRVNFIEELHLCIHLQAVSVGRNAIPEQMLKIVACRMNGKGGLTRSHEVFSSNSLRLRVLI
jgi:hypothetical protein